MLPLSRPPKSSKICMIQVFPRLVGTLLLFCVALHGAEVPPAEKLLPADTLAVVSVPDWPKAGGAWKSVPLVRMWGDAAMQPFRQHFEKEYQTSVLDPLEKDLGMKLPELLNFAQGQLTLALTQEGWQGQPGVRPAWVVLMDSKQESANLKTRLTELRKKWTDSGRKLKTDKIRDVEFTTLFIQGSDAEKAKAEAGGDAAKSAKPTEVLIGQSDSLLLAGSSAKLLEKILVRQSGGAAPGLNEQPAFDSSYQSVLREGLAYGWVNISPIYAAMEKSMGAANAKPAQDNPMAPSPAKVLKASGLGALETASVSLNHGAEGMLVRLVVGAPASKRDGLTKAFVFDAKESGPPPFVPAGVIQFRRWRLDGQKLWGGLEAMIAQISPQLSGVLQMSLGALGKDKDPNFDFRKRFIANLGSDMMSYERAPRSKAPEDLNSPPSLFLLGSPKPAELAEALKAAASLLPTMGGDGVKERDFQGRKIYSLLLPAGMGDDAKPREFQFSATGDYVAMSTDAAMVEEYLRSADTTAKPLREAAGLSEASQRVGGSNSGIFGYDNHLDGMRWTFESLRTGGASVDKIIAGAQVGAKLEVDDDLKQWFDWALLPPFERVEKYFHISVFGGGVDDRGFQLRFFYPTPPALKAATP